MAQDNKWPTHWKDTGCSLFPACLECPLPQCVHDLPGTGHSEARQLKAEAEAKVLARLIDQYPTRAEAATGLNMSERQLFRVLRRARRCE